MKRCTGRTVFNRIFDRCLDLQSIVAIEKTLDEIVYKAASRSYLAQENLCLASRH